MLLPVLVLLISVLLTAGWMTPVHGEETTSDQSSKGISIKYDPSSSIHKVGNVILFCMNRIMRCIGLMIRILSKHRYMKKGI